MEERSTKSGLGKIIRNTSFAVLVPSTLFSFLLGFEPNHISAMRSETPLSSFTYSQYLDASREANGNNFGIDALTTIAYPGAQLGRATGNLFYH